MTAAIPLFDSHAHLDDGRFDGDREEVIARARERGLRYLVNVGYDLDSVKKAVALAEKYDFVYAAVGIHPHDASWVVENGLAEIEKFLAHPKVVAVGEMGLDYYRNLSPREVQERVFREQMALARKWKKPVIIHDRDAHGDTLKILREEKVEEIGGVMHCFSGSWEMARECLKMGMYISIAGPVTFKNAPRVQEVASRVPLDRLLVETDAPYLSPEPFRGKRNEPAYVYYVVEKIAWLRGMEPAELAAITLENGRKLFGVP